MSRGPGAAAYWVWAPDVCRHVDFVNANRIAWKTGPAFDNAEAAALRGPGIYLTTFARVDHE